MSDELILVNLKDEVTGKGEKLWVHENDRLHRAFSVFIVSEGKMLIQKRNKNKYHSGGLWANACCSHPRFGEELSDAVQRRLKEELGISVPVRNLFSFIYRTVFDNGLTEYECDHVFIAEYSGEVFLSEDEIEEVKWISLEDLKNDVLNDPGAYAAWFIIALPRVLEYLENGGK